MTPSVFILWAGWTRIRDGKVVYADQGPVGVLVTERQVRATGEPTLADLSNALIEVYGTDYGIHSPAWISRFTDASRQAEPTARDGCCWLGTPRTYIHPTVDRAFRLVCRMR